MARMFDTEFDYNDETYTATVVINEEDDAKTIAIRVPEELQDMVPERKIVVDGDTEKIETGSPKDPALVESILAAVDKHEESAPPFGEDNVWS